MASGKNKEIGNTGELVAQKYLKKNGFKIVDVNYSKPWGEIDIVAKKDEIYHFIEVKTSIYIKDSVFYPEDRVDYKKQAKIIKTVDSYLEEKGLEDASWQVDIISVRLNMKHRTANCEMFEDIC